MLSPKSKIMQKGKMMWALCFVFAFMAFAFTHGEKTVKIDTTKSSVNWVGYKVTGEHSGTLNVKEGSLLFHDGTLHGGEFTIDMTSMVCTDMEGEDATNLVGHLSSEDFFGVEKYPTAAFKITKAVPYGVDGKYKVVGDVTIKDKTNPVKFIADIREADGMIMAGAEIEIDRTEFDVRYGSGSFFDNLGDKTIYDEFKLTVSLTGTSK